jgi:hypothetical protein
MFTASNPTIAAAFLLAGALLTPHTPLSAALVSQAASSPAATAAADAGPGFTSDLGFSFEYPKDWEVVDSKPMMPAVHLQAEQKADSDLEKRGAACTQVALLVRHGSPASVIVTVALPYECYGAKFAQGDLAGVGTGVSKGLESSFDLKDPVYGAYKSGTHNLWIERAAGSAKAHPEMTYTIETVCSLLDKGMICWMGMLKDEAALKLFENSLVTLETDKPTALVPATAFASAK